MAVATSEKIINVQKRTGETEAFDPSKIASAVHKAALSVGRDNMPLAEKITSIVVTRLERLSEEDATPNVELVQDEVERALIKEGHSKIAKAYILYREEHSRMRKEREKILGGLSTKLPFSTNSLQVLAKRYLQKDESGKVVETPEQMLDRVATTLANVEKDYGKSDKEIAEFKSEFYDILANFEFTPAGRTVTNAGTDQRVVSNCIVLDIPDDMGGIFETLQDAALLQQAGSGLGFAFHQLRPAGMAARTTQGVASGPVSFLRVYNQAFGVIKQQNRHGANMGVMSIEHPDILEFIESKKVEGDIKNFNISVGLTDRFMEQVRGDSKNPWYCEWNGERMKPRQITRDQYGIVTNIEEVTVTARELFMEIVQRAWSNGEPGLVMLDEVNRHNPLPGLGRIEACNPCGEQFLHGNDVCNLGSINLEKFATDDGKIDYDKLRKVTRAATRMLDNVIDITDFPVEKVNNLIKKNRRIGLGIMGFADLLFQIGVGYNTDEGIETGEKIMKFINDTAHEMSQELAEEKGKFGNWDKSVFKESNTPMRNAALTTIAPTGTISMMFEVSGGVEPYFALAYHYQGILGGNTELYYTNKHLKAALEKHGLYTDEIMQRITEEGTLQNIDEIPQEVKNVYVTSMDIAAKDHIRMQAAFQKNIDNSISKTINFPNDATMDEVLEGYIMAWEMGCKGCTVYRDGSRNQQVLNLNKKDKKKTESEVELSVEATQKPMDASVASTTPEPVTSGTTTTATASTVTASATGTAILTKSKTADEAVDNLLKKNLSNIHVTDGNMAGETISMTKSDMLKRGECPECSTKLQIEEGCFNCRACGFSACSV